jgi:hypothetical protein
MNCAPNNTFKKFNVHGSKHRINILVYNSDWVHMLHVTIAADNSTGTDIIHYSIELIASSAEYRLFNNCNFNLVYRYPLPVNLTLSITV